MRDIGNDIIQDAIKFGEDAVKDIWQKVLKPRAADLKDAAIDALKDAGRGKFTIDEWAKIAIKGVDMIKTNTLQQNDLRYIGGKLKFVMPNEPQSGLEKVMASFELYFQDTQEKWKKVGSESEIPADNFTNKALEELKEKKEVSFEVE